MLGLLATSMCPPDMMSVGISPGDTGPRYGLKAAAAAAAAALALEAARLGATENMGYRRGVREREMGQIRSPRVILYTERLHKKEQICGLGYVINTQAKKNTVHVTVQNKSAFMHCMTV